MWGIYGLKGKTHRQDSKRDVAERPRLGREEEEEGGQHWAMGPSFLLAEGAWAKAREWLRPEAHSGHPLPLMGLAPSVSTSAHTHADTDTLIQEIVLMGHRACVRC